MKWAVSILKAPEKSKMRWKAGSIYRMKSKEQGREKPENNEGIKKEVWSSELPWHLGID